MKLNESKEMNLIGRGADGQLLMPGYRLYEYLLVLNPHEELRERIQKVRQEFGVKYNPIHPVTGKPNLALVNFIQYQLMEERLLGRLRTIAMGFPPFKVELKDFGSYPSHSIFINVASKVALHNLVRELRSGAQKLMKLNDENTPHFIPDPVMLIARKLLPWQYEKGWLEYSHRHFTRAFIAENMLLLKRPVGSFNYEVVESFAFQNLPVHTRQGELFG